MRVLTKEGIFMKKLLSFLFSMMLIFVCASPVLATNIVPYGTTVTSGGLLDDTTYGQYYLYGSATGQEEYKTVTATLYAESGDYVYSTSNSGTSYRVDTGAYIPFELDSGRYKVQVVAVTHNSVNSGFERYYEI